MDFLIACTGINYVILLLWFLCFRFVHDGLYRLHSRWFRVSVETFDALHYGGMAFYKILILFFNLTPLLVLLATR